MSDFISPSLLSTLLFAVLRKFFVLKFQFVFVHERVLLAFSQKYHFKSSDAQIPRVQMSQRNNPAPSDGRQNSLVLPKMAQNDSRYCSSKLCALHGEKRGRRTEFLVFGF